MSPDPDRELVSITQAIAILGVCRATIYNWMNSGRVECVRTAGGQPRIYADSLTAPYLGSTLPIPKGAFTARRG
jgi:hypothetical protein